MAAVAEIVSLLVDGQALQGWQSISITHSIDCAALSFDLAATNPAWSSQAGILRTGKVLQIYTTPDGILGTLSGGDLLSTGYVDQYTSQAGLSAARSVSVSGRTKPADMIDCEPTRHATGFVENKDIVEVAREFDEWGLTFQTDTTLNKIPYVQRVPGETLFQTLEREARRQGVFIMGEPDGSVMITNGTKGRAAGLREGESPLEAFRLVDQLNVANSECLCRGQQSEGVDEQALRQEEKVENPSLFGRHRPIIVWNEGSNTTQELKARAEWELKRRNGRRLQLHCHVASWRDNAGALWKPRTPVPVQIPSEGLDLDLAIHSVTFNQQVGEGEGTGTWADLTLVYPDTLDKRT